MNKIQLLALYAVAVPSIVCFDNDNASYIPEMWVNESLMILEESMVMSNLVHRDFQNSVQSFGDTVNTRRPSKFTSSRKTGSDSVVAQDAVSTNVQVMLDQHHYNTFVIKDEEGSKSFLDLVDIYLKPAVQAVGRGIDRSVIGQAHRFFGGPTTRVGGLLQGSSSNVRGNIVSCREQLNVLNVPQDEMRHLVVAPGTESDMLNTDLFVRVNESGGASALRRAQIGNLFGFNIYAANNTPAVSIGQCDVATGTVTSARLANAAAASVPVTVTAYEVNVGEWFTIAGNDQPMFATAVTASTNTTAVTPNEVQKNASAGSAVITVYKSFAAKGTYAAGYSKGITVDGYTQAPTAGRIISIGTGGSRKNYTVIESYAGPASDWIILLDRPLEAELTDNDRMFPAPAGEYNLAFHRNAIALVNRPLARPMGGAGVLSTVASNGSLAMRICMQYDSVVQGTRVTVDTLSGVALLDANMGTLFLA
jgi:hypothetical protein